MAASQVAVATTLEGWVGRDATWMTNGAPKDGPTSLLVEVLSQSWDRITAVPAPTNIGSGVSFACYEMPIFAAIKTHGAITGERCRQLCDALWKGGLKKSAPLMANGKAASKKYGGLFGSGWWAQKPVRGDLLFFMGSDSELLHVVLATGVANGGDSEVLSFWGRHISGPVTAQVERTSVSALQALIVRELHTTPSIYSGSPVW